MKKKLLAISAILICLSITVAGTLAAFTAEGRATNVITTGDVTVNLVEEKNEAGDKWEDATGVMPGQSIYKKVYAENVGTGDAWVRMKVTKEVSGGLSADVIGIDFGDKWEQVDGWYYYTGVLKPAEKTAPLFTHVTFDAQGMDNSYQNCTAKVNVTMQAVQVKNNGDSALTANGWPA